MPSSGYFDTAFAVAGTKTIVPDPIQGSGAVSYNQGYGILYSTPVASGGLDFPRAQLNQILYDITLAIQNWQQNTIAPFITSSMNGGSPYSYSQYNMVMSGGVAYISLVNSNADTPPSSKWGILNLGNIGLFLGGTSTGSANAQVLASPTPSGFAQTAGYFISVIAGFTNTGSTTFNIGATGAEVVYKNATGGLVVLTGGEIQAGGSYLLYCNAPGSYVLLNPTIVSFVGGAIHGNLITSLTGSHTTASATITAGRCEDSTAAAIMVSAGYSWAASNGNAINGTDAGSSTLANSTTYHMFLCSGTSGTGTFCSASLTPTFPAGYTTYNRRIGSFKTDGSGNPISYVSVENAGGGTINWLTTQTADVSTSSLGTARTLYTLNVPGGVKVQPLIRASSSTGSSNAVILTSGDETDVAPQATSISTAPGFDLTGNSLSQPLEWQLFLTTNTSAQIGARGSTTSMELAIITRGWIDFRRS